MDEFFMKKALELARKGEGYVNPNPLVGAVIVKGGEIIGQGYHEFFGGNHAEVNAINSSIKSTEGATIYVTLEPCCHYGKTPPCVEAIIKNKFKRVVIGTLDPNPLVSGKSIKILRESGIEVKVGVLEKECIRLNEIFNFYIKESRPFIALKWAMTLD
ncbi:bifunctional diaminohydroxyphosphoribosylaminopyrimidine deaminase/5-amino-6-(5-phosphoribosylamino)uracil reductase RibD, partial [Clostridium perfringens]